MTYQDILFSLEGGIARITLNRPEKLNSFTAQMHGELSDALLRVQQGRARVLVLTGAGRGFCAGQDLNDRQMSAGDAPPDLGETIERYYAPLVLRMRALACPIVVGVNGVAAGAGANIALAGDIVIAKESASFIQAFCRLGLLPDTGGTFILPRLVGHARAMGLSLLGDKLTARQAQDWGLIWQCVADENFDAELNRLAEHFAQAPTRGMALTKQALNASFTNKLDEQLDLERDLMRELGRTKDYAEGVSAFLEKRTPQFRGE